MRTYNIVTFIGTTETTKDFYFLSYLKINICLKVLQLFKNLSPLRKCNITWSFFFAISLIAFHLNKNLKKTRFITHVKYIYFYFFPSYKKN